MPGIVAGVLQLVAPDVLKRFTIKVDQGYFSFFSERRSDYLMNAGSHPYSEEGSRKGEKELVHGGTKARPGIGYGRRIGMACADIEMIATHVAVLQPTDRAK